jgi:hypothetical protein
MQLSKTWFIVQSFSLILGVHQAIFILSHQIHVNTLKKDINTIKQYNLQDADFARVALGENTYN